MYITREKKRSHSGSKEEWLRNGLFFKRDVSLLIKPNNWKYVHRQFKYKTMASVWKYLFGQIMRESDE